mmetsp:Transcript_37854/g.95141  ORF Transcript_37854/g.95141 Transcript_37854/m.95141 type:complete len:256 (-) Transcript_37854:265-1032(-)
MPLKTRDVRTVQEKVLSGLVGETRLLHSNLNHVRRMRFNRKNNSVLFASELTKETLQNIQHTGADKVVPKARAMREKASIKDDKEVMRKVECVKERTTHWSVGGRVHKHHHNRDDVTSCAGKGGPTKGPRLTGGVVVQVVCQSMSQPGDRNPPSNQLVEGNVRVEREDMTKECSTKSGEHVAKNRHQNQCTVQVQHRSIDTGDGHVIGWCPIFDRRQSRQNYIRSGPKKQKDDLLSFMSPVFTNILEGKRFFERL